MAHECSCHHGSSISPAVAVLQVRSDETVGEVVRHRAGALEIMQRMGIDHCCGGHLTLGEAAAAAGVTVDALLAALNEPPKTPA